MGGLIITQSQIKSVVAVPISVPVPVNLISTEPILTVTTTTSPPSNHSTPVYPSPVPTNTTNTVTPALIPKTTNVPINRTITVAPAP